MSFDWNQNGQDDFIEYSIYEECTKDDDSNNHSNCNYTNKNHSQKTGCGVWGWVSIILIVLGLLSKCGS